MRADLLPARKYSLLHTDNDYAMLVVQARPGTLGIGSNCNQLRVLVWGERGLTTV
jgi:hypothetical protein